MTSPGEALVDLARGLGRVEALTLAERIERGDSRAQVVRAAAAPRRAAVRALLEGEPPPERAALATALRCVAAAKDDRPSVDLLWTAPGGLAGQGGLTSSLRHLVDSASQSVVCATYNFQRTSAQWEALRAAAARPDLSVRVYLDQAAADANPRPWSPTTQQVADELAGATVLRSRPWRGGRTRTHAKFFVVDSRVLVVTSANFSVSAEQHNVELGIRVDDPLAAAAVVRQMRDLEADLYEVVSRTSGSPAPRQSAPGDVGIAD